MLVDYADILTRIERGLGRSYAEFPTILNVPGASAALKLDPYYYLALRPLFFELLGKWAAVPPTRVEETLIRTGNLVLGPGKTRFPRPLAAFEESTGTRLQLTADFVPAACIDRAVVLYGGEQDPLPVSRLRVLRAEKPRIEAFFAGKTPLLDVAYADLG